jgi:hypothetical protein
VSHTALSLGALDAHHTVRLLGLTLSHWQRNGGWATAGSIAALVYALPPLLPLLLLLVAAQRGDTIFQLHSVF